MSNPLKPNDKRHIANGIGFVGLLLWLIGAAGGGWWLIPLGFVLMIPAFDGWFRD